MSEYQHAPRRSVHKVIVDHPGVNRLDRVRVEVIASYPEDVNLIDVVALLGEAHNDAQRELLVRLEEQVVAELTQ